jgi:hypothetical protein
MASMGSLQGLIRAILWLSKREWDLSILLGFASILALAAIPVKNPISEAILEGPVFRAGFYVGTVLVPLAHRLFANKAVTHGKVA